MDRRTAMLGRRSGDEQPATGDGWSRVTLTIGALGVVFGDIGTSPLYAMQAAFSGDHRFLEPTPDVVYGVISLVVWTITLVVTVKYVTFIMRADNGGEGGIMALIALIQGATSRVAIVTVGVFGAALFYGDGMITPAISVLSAVEGLQIAAPGLGSLVLPIALVVLGILFSLQRYGTGAVGGLFGPIMGLWFAVLALSGLRQVVESPEILRALSPSYAVAFCVGHSALAFVALASVVLTVTGAEALYADMGHFGRSPIRRAWLLIVFPALTLNYAGQGALILETPSAAANPFFLLIPPWGRIPTVMLATAATVIASQAVISGAFSLTHQAVQLGFLPRLTIHHTSEREVGQVYAPAINWALCAAVATLVVGFGSAEHLASAYGIAVTGTMAITTILFFVVAGARFKQPTWLLFAVCVVFLSVDVALFSASLTKVTHGGWLPLAVAISVFAIMTTWRRGHERLVRNRTEQEGPLRRFVEDVRAGRPPRAPETAVFLHSNGDTTPLALRANVKFNHMLHETVVIVLLETLNTPHVVAAARTSVDDLGYRDDGITHVTIRFGFRDRQDVPAALALADMHRLERPLDVERAVFFLSRITIVPTSSPGLRRWRKHLFIAMWRNQTDPARYFGLPDERTAIMGSLIEL
jgi:KUP system potassium uptake protein